MLILRESRIEDFDDIEVTEDAQKMIDAWPDFANVKRHYMQQGTLFTYEDEGRIVCIWGCVTLWQGVGELVLYAGTCLRDYIQQARFVKRAIAKNNLGFDRLQMTVRTDDMHVRIAEFLGFQREGLLRKYVNRYDYYCYSRIDG